MSSKIDASKVKSSPFLRLFQKLHLAEYVFEIAYEIGVQGAMLRIGF